MCSSACILIFIYGVSRCRGWKLFDFPISSFIGSLVHSVLVSLPHKCCSYPPFPFHSQRYFVAQTLTDSHLPASTSSSLHPLQWWLPHWLFLIHKLDHVISLLINLKPSGSPLSTAFFTLYSRFPIIWLQPISSLPPPWKYYTTIGVSYSRLFHFQPHHVFSCCWTCGSPRLECHCFCDAFLEFSRFLNFLCCS